MTDVDPYESNTENLPVSGNMTILTNLFTAPSKAMGQIQEGYGIVFPLFFMLLMTGAVMFSYYSMLDYDWYIDYVVDVSTADASNTEKEQAREIFAMMSQSVMGLVATATAMIATAVVYLAQALYFVIISKINNDGFEFKQWFSFICWTSMPNLLAIIAMFALLFSSSTGQIVPDSLNPLSLNELFFGLEPSKGLGKMLSTIHLPQMGSYALMIIGYQMWSKKSMFSSAAIVLTPFVLFYAGWSLFI